MGLRVQLHVLEFTATITDMAALNRDARVQRDFAELYENELDNDPSLDIFAIKNGELLVQAIDFESGERYPIFDTYGLIQPDSLEFMVRYISHGQIVFMENVEGNNPNFFVVDSKSARVAKATWI